MDAVEEQFPHEKQEVFHLACEMMKSIATLQLDNLPGDVGEVMENAVASAFSEMVSALSHDNPDGLALAISELDFAAGCLEAVRVFERIAPELHCDLRHRLLRWRELMDELWTETGKECGIVVIHREEEAS